MSCLTMACSGGSRSVVARLRGMVLAVGAVIVPVAALVVLAGRLPAHFQAGGDLRPPDAQRDSVVDQGRRLRLGFLPHDAGALIRSSTCGTDIRPPAAPVLVVLPVPGAGNPAARTSPSAPPAASPCPYTPGCGHRLTIRVAQAAWSRRIQRRPARLST